MNIHTTLHVVHWEAKKKGEGGVLECIEVFRYAIVCGTALAAILGVCPAK